MPPKKKPSVNSSAVKKSTPKKNIQEIVVDDDDSSSDSDIEIDGTEELDTDYSDHSDSDDDDDIDDYDDDADAIDVEIDDRSDQSGTNNEETDDDDIDVDDDYDEFESEIDDEFSDDDSSDNESDTVTKKGGRVIKGGKQKKSSKTLISKRGKKATGKAKKTKFINDDTVTDMTDVSETIDNPDETIDTSQGIIEDEDDYIDEDFEFKNDDDSEDIIYNRFDLKTDNIKRIKLVPYEKYKTSHQLTEYEMVEIVSLRASEIERGSPVFVDITGLTNPIDMAKKELYERKCPLILRRFVDTVNYEDWDINMMLLRD